MYLTKNDWRMFDGIASIENLDEAQLRQLASRVSKEVDEYCNTRFTPTEDAYTLDYHTTVYLRRRPLLSVTALCLHGQPLTEDVDYFVYPDAGRVDLRAGCRTPKAQEGKKALFVQYCFGYAAVPSTVKQAMLELIKLYVEAKGLPSAGVQSESWDSEYTYSLHGSKDLTPAALRQSILSRLDAFVVPPYREPTAAGAVSARLI